MRVGVFDSGLGGLTVLNKALDILPHEHFLYFADVDHVPYGEKTREQIVEFVDGAVDYMVNEGCKAIVIACNTATSAGVDFLREKYDFLPIIGIEPAVKPAVLHFSGGKRVLVVATPITVKGEKLKRLIETYDKDHIVDTVALSELVNYAEKGIFDTDIIVPYLHDALKNFNPDDYGVLVLGCTHFNFFKDSFKIVMPGVQIIDGSTGSASYLKTRMEEEGLLATKEDRTEEEKVIYVESGRPVTDKAELEKIDRLCKRWRELN